MGHRLFERDAAVGDVRVLRKDHSPLRFIVGNRCEGKADGVAVCPVRVFQVSTLPRDLRVGLTLRGRLKGMAHRWQQARLVDAVVCEACGSVWSCVGCDGLMVLRRFFSTLGRQASAPSSPRSCNPHC
jgi:hypothetical protein